jgi:NCAIR mutase (PurE)-related protein
MSTKLTEQELGNFATLDFERAERCGFPEVIFGLGKTPEQVSAIMSALAEQNEVVLCTRATLAAAEATQALLPEAVFVSSCGILYYDRRDGDLRISGDNAPEILGHPGGSGNVIVCCAGTSDLSVTHEAALTARIMGSRVTMITDIGIAGVHRTLAHTDTLRSATVIVVVAGMEGALPSLVAGLVEVPVIAVPTSVGYGASFGGLSALLGMLNSCANGVSVVNIDNGFGAGVIAHRINSPVAGYATGDAAAPADAAGSTEPASPTEANSMVFELLDDEDFEDITNLDEVLTWLESEVSNDKS